MGNGDLTRAEFERVVNVKRSIELYRREMQAAGITHALVPGRSSPEITMGVRFPAVHIPNEHIAELEALDPNHVIGFAAIDVSGQQHDPVKELERILRELKLRGLFVEPGRSLGSGLSDRRLYPLYEFAQSAGVPVMVMTGPYAGATIEATHPVAIDTVANDFPKLSIVCGHGCWPYVDEIIGVAFRHRNVYVSPDIYVFVPGASRYVEAATVSWPSILIRDRLPVYVRLSKRSRTFARWACARKAYSWRCSITRPRCSA